MARTDTEFDTIDVEGITLSHPDKTLYAGIGLTKRDLAAYYAVVHPRMLPLVSNRLLSLVRCPQGQGHPCFFQKHPGKGVSPGIHIAEIEERKGDDAHYLFIDDAQGLVALVQIGALEIHLWGSSIDDIERPDRLVMDIDPDESLAFGEVKRAARDLRARLAALGLESFAMVTGGKGVHVVAPLERRREWPEVKAFARGLANEMAGAEPHRFVAQASKKQREGRIFIDYLRNDRGSTAIAPYSTRARAGAPVATPVTWKELEELSGADSFTIDKVSARIGRADPWRGYRGLRQSITKRALAAVKAGA